MAQIEKKIASGDTHALTPPSEDAAEPRKGADVIDLVSLLRKSLDKKGKGADVESEEEEAPQEQTKRAAARKPASSAGAREESREESREKMRSA